MDLLVEPSSIVSGNILVPGDKSISHRALMLGSVGDGISKISGFLSSEDCIATMTVLRQLGISIQIDSQNYVIVEGKGLSGLQIPDQPLNMGNSGTAMRLFSGLLSGQKFPVKIIGDESLSKRPMGRIIKPLNLMGSDIHGVDDKAPLNISGGSSLNGIEYQLPVPSAQVKSALLLAGLYANGEIIISEPEVTRDHTEKMLIGMNASIAQQDGLIKMSGGQALKSIDIKIPADLSSAAFFILLGSIYPNIELYIKDVGINPTRTGVISILKKMGARIELRNIRSYGQEPVADIVVISSNLSGIEVDPSLVSLAIDEFPILFVAAACANGVTKFTGIRELRFKESDRIASMARSLVAMGIRIEYDDDSATIHGGTLSGGCEIDSQGDHRIAMASIIGALTCDEKVLIKNVKNINTSFPSFTECLKSLNANTSLFI